MPSLEHGNNRYNYLENITHGQLIGKQISYRPYRRIASFNGYFYKEDFLTWLLDLEELFHFENIYYERNVKLALYKLSGCTFHQPRHEGIFMWLDMDLTCGVAVSRGRGNVGYKILSLAHANGVTALERK